jgi:hypothetical protein
MNPDTPAGFSDPSPNFEESDSEGPDLSRLKLSALEMLTHQQEQTVRKGVKQKPELVGDKPMAAEPIGFELKLQLLDTILGITPKDIDFVIDPLGVETEIGHHKPLIGAFVSVLGLDAISSKSPPDSRRSQRDVAWSPFHETHSPPSPKDKTPFLATGHW